MFFYWQKHFLFFIFCCVSIFCFELPPLSFIGVSVHQHFTTQCYLFVQETFTFKPTQNISQLYFPMGTTTAEGLSVDGIPYLLTDIPIDNFIYFQQENSGFVQFTNTTNLNGTNIQITVGYVLVGTVPQITPQIFSFSWMTIWPIQV